MQHPGSNYGPSVKPIPFPTVVPGADLSGVKVQLDSAAVVRMTEVLHLAKSSYLGRFTKLAQEIQDGSQQAQR